MSSWSRWCSRRRPRGSTTPWARSLRGPSDAGALLLVDAVSALGCEEVLVDEWGIDVCVAGPQKCLAGPPGMSLMSIRPPRGRRWSATRARRAAPSSPCSTGSTDWVDSDRTKFLYTPSVVDVNGVDSVVDQVLDEGLDTCIARHQTAARAVRAGVQAMGLELWARREAYAAGCVTAIRVPEGIGRADALAHIRDRYGVMLSGGYGELADKVFRIGHMGPAADSLNPVVAVSALGRGLKDLGADVRIGAGVEATLEVIGEAAERTVSAREHAAAVRAAPAGSVEDASRCSTELGDDAVVLSGGTELLLLMKLGFADHPHLVDVKRIAELRGLERRTVLEVGAALTHREVERPPSCASAGRRSRRWSAASATCACA